MDLILEMHSFAF